MEKFAAELRRWRADQGLTQVQAAAHFGVPTKTYQEWERGRQKPQQMGPIRKLMVGMTIGIQARK